MNKLPVLLAALVTAAMIALIAPNVIASNRGKILRNIAIWLAIIVALALVYKFFAPNDIGGKLILPRH